MNVKRILGIKPNGVTVTAVRHPLAYSVGTAVLVLGIAAVSLKDFGLVWVFAVGGAAAVLVGVGNWLIWRQGGPAHRWALRDMPPEMAKAAGLPPEPTE